MSQLRRDRLPYVLIGILALIAQLVLLSTGLPDAIDRAQLASLDQGQAQGLVICTSDGSAAEPGRGHDPVHCPCGPACLHQIAPFAIAAETATDNVPDLARGPAQALASQTAPLAARLQERLIRGPPFV